MLIVHSQKDADSRPSSNIFTSQSVRVKKKRLAIVAGHPVQYVAPWLAQLAKREEIEIHVFYLWDFGVVQTKDPGFGITLEWDIPLLDGYPYSFVQNFSRDPGNHHFLGYINPGLSSCISKWKPDTILLMNYAFLSYFLLLIDPRLWAIPIIFRGDSHDVGRKNSLRTSILRTLRRIIFARFSAFLDVGKNNRNYILASGVPRHKLHHAPHAIDNQRFQIAKSQAQHDGVILRKRLGIGEEKILICFVGKLIPIKRPFDLLHAFASLTEEMKENASLLYVGDGKLKSELEAYSQSLRSLYFLEFQNQSNMPSVYAASDLLVLPSQSETWGLVVNEAMNLSCPAVVSDHVGCAPDLIIPDLTGWVYPTGNIRALSHYLSLAISNPGHLRQMGENAAELVRDFSFDSLTDGLLTAIDATTVNHPSRKLKSAKIDA